MCAVGVSEKDEGKIRKSEENTMKAAGWAAWFIVAMLIVVAASNLHLQDAVDGRPCASV